MNTLKARLLSLPSILVFSALGVGLSTVLIFPVSRFIISSSDSVSANFQYVALFMGLLALTAVPLTLLIARLIWGAGTFGGEQKKTDTAGGDDDPALNMPHLNVTGSKLAFIYVLVLMVAVLAYDLIGKGTLFLDTRRWGVFAELRSTDADNRRSGADGAVYFPGDPDIARLLGRIVDQPGEGRQWAALSIGARLDKDYADSLLTLAQTGTAVERAAAIGSLARLKDGRFVQGVNAAWPHLDTYRADAFLAIAMLGKNTNALSRKDLEDLGSFVMDAVDSQKLDRDLTRLAILALNRLETPLGLVWLEGLLEKEKDVQTLCMVLEALGNIGAADSSPKMIAFFDSVDPKGHCDEAVAVDFAGRQILIRSKAGILPRTLVEIAHIGDSRALPDMVRISKDSSRSPEVRKMAADIAYQLQFRSSGGSL